MKKYNREEVYAATLQYFDGDELAANVWIDKYCLKNNGQYLEKTPDDMHRRLAKEFARIESKYPNPMSEEEIFHLLKDFKYLVPQGSPMAGIGNNFATTSISNCFVIGNDVDSYGGIMKSDEEQAQLMKRRGGVGQDISYLRPSGALAGTQSLGDNAGTTLYMERFSNTTREVQQDGRRGALMLSISIAHPDSEKFIDKKMESGKVTGANVSVKITDDFMRAVDQGLPYYQTFPIEYGMEEVTGTLVFDIIEHEENKLYEGLEVDGKKTYFKRVDAQKLWDKIVHNAWKSAEPGILFWDQILNESPAADYGEKWKERSTNPCGEIPLNPYDSCRLLAVNLFSYVNNSFQRNAIFDVALFNSHVKKAQRLMDDIVDLEIEKIDKIIEKILSKKHPHTYQKVELDLWSKIKRKAIEGRRTGLGILGEADMLAALGVKYGTGRATQVSVDIHQIFAEASFESSVQLAKERGAFPIWRPVKETKSGFLKRMLEESWLAQHVVDGYNIYGKRNIGLLTIAPTGSTSLLTQTSSGIEPVFAPYHYRKKKLTENEAEFDFEDENGDKWIEFPVFHKRFVEWFMTWNELGLNYQEALVTLKKKSKQEMQFIFENSPYFEATAQDVDYVEKVRMQGEVQKWIDHSISVTVNMPENATEKMVSAVYKQAHKSGCKGITVYRENSRGNVLSTSSVKGGETDFEYTDSVKRPKALDCDIFFEKFRGQELIVLVGKLNNKPYEVFTVPFYAATSFSKKIGSGTIVKNGKGKYQLDSKKGRKPVIIEDICSHMTENEQNETRSLSALLRHRVNPLFIAQMIGKFATISSFHKVLEKVILTYVDKKEIAQDNCPECGETMRMTEGCMKCTSCGYAKCG